METLNVAVVGAGYMGSLHAGKLAAMPEVKVSAVVDVDATRAESLAAKVGARPYTSLVEAIANAHAAIVAVPTECHAAVVRECVPRGLHLLVGLKLATSLGRKVDDLAYAPGATFNINTHLLVLCGFFNFINSEYPGQSILHVFFSANNSLFAVDIP